VVCTYFVCDCVSLILFGVCIRIYACFMKFLLYINIVITWSPIGFSFAYN